MNIRAFRANLKDHFDKVEAGYTVVIERNGVLFELVKSGITARVHAKPVEVASTPVVYTPKDGVCKQHGFPVYDGKSICGQKNCKG